MTATNQFSEGSEHPVLARMWWAVSLKGVAIILFGALAYFVFGSSLPLLTVLFAGYALADGALGLIAANRGGGFTARLGFSLAGLISLAAGATAALLPAMTSSTLAIIVGAWAAARGVVEFASALKLRQVMFRDWSLAGIGALSVLFGGGLLLNSAIDPWTMVRLLGAYSLIAGVLMLLLGRRFRSGMKD